MLVLASVKIQPQTNVANIGIHRFQLRSKGQLRTLSSMTSCLEKELLGISFPNPLQRREPCLLQLHGIPKFSLYKYDQTYSPSKLSFQMRSIQLFFDKHKYVSLYLVLQLISLLALSLITQRVPYLIFHSNRYVGSL